MYTKRGTIAFEKYFDPLLKEPQPTFKATTVESSTKEKQQVTELVKMASK